MGESLNFLLEGLTSPAAATHEEQLEPVALPPQVLGCFEDHEMVLSGFVTSNHQHERRSKQTQVVVEALDVGGVDHRFICGSG